MAQAPQQAGDGAANFVRHIVSDPKNVPDVMLLTGYLGASSEEDHERLYLSPDLTNYVEISKAAILHQAALPTEQDAHGGVTVWVKKDAALQYKMAPAAQALANYFAGAIQARAQGAAPAADALTHPTRFCRTHHVTCAAACEPTHFCATEITPCLNTHAVTCACPLTAACRTQQPPCQSLANCNSIGCDATIVCTIDFPGCLTAGFCRDAPQAAAAASIAAPCLPHTPFCPTRIGCPPPTHHFTCAHICTHVTPCLPTRFEPQCPFPTEICTHAAGCHTLQPGFCPLPQAAGAGAAPQARTIFNCRSFIDCSFVCPTRFEPQCQTNHVTCNPVCHFTNPVVCQRTGPGCFSLNFCFTNPEICQVTGPNCPPVSLACPQGSLACGGFPG